MSTRPVKEGYVTSGYGMRVRNGIKEFHRGIDISCASGNDNILCVEGGKIVSLGSSPTYGFRIWVRIKSGIYDIYGHMKSLNPALKVNMLISEGDLIGIMGSTGMSEGNHLHYGRESSPDGHGVSYDPKHVTCLY